LELGAQYTFVLPRGVSTLYEFSPVYSQNSDVSSRSPALAISLKAKRHKDGSAPLGQHKYSELNLNLMDQGRRFRSLRDTIGGT
jgi:hypothetical protein